MIGALALSLLLAYATPPSLAEVLPAAALAAFETDGLGTEDVAALRDLHDGYVRDWLANNEAGVLGAFTDDAVLLPHHGLASRRGRAQLQQFWFPAGAPPTRLVTYEHQIERIDGEGDHAVIYGRFNLVWDTSTHRIFNEGNVLMVARRTGQGWRFTHMIWNDPPNRREPLRSDGGGVP
ncbi:nuclear transport factor 2 family protein [Brevundimonas sp. 2R-24]|uniref:Nuclear transport factor 2 family protein n=1 Tax=Peiella sedimenti TaxID=3061083 RepID=A0ABT8SPE8_9CAUL|nr:nuclear transport factor 2 family protein [Caulobacteraceae bacterium XZ-24]